MMFSVLSRGEKLWKGLPVLLLVLAAPSVAWSQPGQDTPEAPMMRGDTGAAENGWTVDPLFTVGEELAGYRPAGILDGLGALRWGSGVRVLVNHELSADDGTVYTLRNGTRLTGARVSYIDVREKAGQRRIRTAGLAYHTVVDRAGLIVTDPAQINEGDADGALDGFDRFCSAYLAEAGTYGLMDDIFFTGEETSDGQEFALDVRRGVLWAVPQMGRAAFENVTLVDTGSDETVGFLVGDDREGAPLYLYIGRKNALAAETAAGSNGAAGNFLDRNGLARGDLYVWVADNGDADPEAFNGTGESRTGSFVRVVQWDPDQAGMEGYDALGYADQATLDAQVEALGGFRFSRPEDVARNPEDGTQVVLASTGRGSRYPSDNWGTTYLVDLDFGGPVVTATLTILYDGDDAGAGQFSDPDYGLRSPDNLDWASDGMIYAQEDRSTSPGSLFGGVSGIEASVWKLDPSTGTLTRILEMDRAAVPADQSDPSPGDIGNWESSGVIEVTHLFDTEPGETLLLIDVQAHSLQDGRIEEYGLVQGGQLLLASYRPEAASRTGSATGMQVQGADVAAGVPSAFSLESAYPNPFNPSTTLAYTVPADGRIRITVFDARGRQVRELVNGVVTAGRYEVTFEAVGLSSGLYVARMDTPQGFFTKKLLLVK